VNILYVATTVIHMCDICVNDFLNINCTRILKSYICCTVVGVG